MSNYKEENICMIHHSQIVAINMDLNSDCQLRRYCSKCLLEKTYDGTIYINSEVQEHIQKIKEEYLEKKAYFLKHNVGTIESLQNAIQNIKVTFSYSLDKIFENLSTEKIRLQNQYFNIEETLNGVDLNNFHYFKLQSNENLFQIESFKSLIKASIDQIKNNESLQFCNQQIENLQEDDEVLTFTRGFNSQESNVIATPSLKILCQMHKKQIIAFDMNINRAKENRMACIQCIEEIPNSYTSLKTVQDKWKKFEEFKKNKYQQILEQNKENKDQILEQLKIISEAHNEMNLQITQYLNDYCQSLNQEMQQIFSQMGKNWAICQQKEIFDNIEKLITPTCNQEFSKNISEHYANEEKFVNLNVFDSIKKIRETLKESFYQISKMIKINSNLQIKSKEIQICEKLQSIRPPFSMNSKQVELSLSIESPRKLQVTKDVVQMSLKIKKFKLNLVPKSVSLSLQITLPSKLKIDKQQIQISMVSKQQKIRFENIIEGQKVTQDQNCYALIFDHTNNLLVAGCGQNIQTFKFNSGSFQSQSVFGQHYSNVTALCFIKFNQFISGDAKGQLQFWKEESNSWKQYQKLSSEHFEQINQILYSKKFNQIITCSNDKNITVLENKNQQVNIWACAQTISSHQSNVCSISLNDSETTLISSGSDKQLQIYSRQINFNLIQTIKVEDIIYRLQFIEDSSFCAQIQTGIHLNFYNFNKNQEQYILNQTAEVQNQKSCSQGFPIGICKKHSMILCKHGTYINVLKKMNNQIYRTEQSINFDTMYLYGALTSDGNYLVTWDYRSKQFQVRQLIVN
ncbi:unnamed protein product (macronuclear) [Paramecium tetraurelia]|uniref:Uncharacterized protein n=1 Tax=Paramecium tetraurelia TaxID=5888 RepID=A0BM14_PARTE|nr:uncharacterized protein GSPATT00030215001 [Paramecium tetraurelia]CAK59581.1 unnamed protein product [Paramecium tetraurelia]|eukprot:XP_001426979.1 hypothetical protein (macronuclear) [Paramecium tetraurelia strain d4-2]